METTKITLENLTPQMVASVYSGKPGRCCCGCSGIHRHASGDPRLATEPHLEVNDRFVKQVTNMVKVLATFNASNLCEQDTCVSAETAKGRLYIVYLKPEFNFALGEE